MEAGIRRAVVNTGYLAEQIEAHLAARMDIEIVISREEELLETGGGIAHALRHFDGAFFALNADLPFPDGPQPSLQLMKEAWRPDAMDALLLLMQTEKARGFSPQGDFFMEEDGRLARHNRPPPRPYVMISAQLLKPDLFRYPPARVFSNSLIWDGAEARGRLYGAVHGGTCYHIGTPEDLRQANALLQSGDGWAV